MEPNAIIIKQNADNIVKIRMTQDGTWRVIKMSANKDGAFTSSRVIFENIATEQVARLAAQQHVFIGYEAR